VTDWKNNGVIYFFVKTYDAFLNSLRGIFRALKEEYAFQVEFILSLFLIPASFFIGKDILEIVLLIGSTLLILIVELLNTAIETILNRISVEENDLTKYAKDAASGAVLFSLILWLIIWSLVLIY
jgi:diacylglycerol kinase (ATP)|tara:strand:- start:1385 stop:1759 length:375 start_codon:yes stop_codon:yes gene_type:complete